jgi:lysosomal Pro-X carboxypeptidase
MQVQLYLNATGLMWENAERLGAMLIFAEHRYYGESLPFGKHTYKHMEWLSSEQALADYAALLFAFREERGLRDAPVIGFGGSYGGMLATWARQKYPHVRTACTLMSLTLPVWLTLLLLLWSSGAGWMESDPAALGT